MLFSLTRSALSASFGAGRSDAALLAVPLVLPAVVTDVTCAAVEAGSNAVRWLRKRAAKALRSVAAVLDPLPTAHPVLVRYARLSLPVVSAPAPVVIESAPVLAMPSAAQETVAPVEPVEPLDYPGLVKQHGSLRAAAKAIGVAESTFRRRLKR